MVSSQTTTRRGRAEARTPRRTQDTRDTKRTPRARSAGSRASRTGRARLNPQDLEKVRFVLENKYEAVYHEKFDEPDAERELYDEAPEIAMPDTSWYHPVIDRADESLVPKTNGQVLLSAADERVLFYKFNYARYRVQLMKDKLEGRSVKQVGPRQAEEIVKWYDRAEALRDQIAQINLALVLAMAKRTRMSESDFGEMISEGNMALLRAIDKFDASRGFKFSTYACRAILKAFSRMGMKQTRYRAFFPTDFDPALERSNFMESKRRGHEEDCADEVKAIVQNNRADLTDIEQEVIEHRFGIAKPEMSDDQANTQKNRDQAKREDDDEARPLTLEQVGRIIGVTKERVRQIQNKALEKIRVSLEDSYLN